jgi:hypothetical protein
VAGFKPGTARLTFASWARLFATKLILDKGEPATELIQVGRDETGC